MASVFDVAKYILSKTGTITTMKLQKLVYYCQAWHLVWHEEALFKEEIQAWANGPVCPAQYNEHRGAFKISYSNIRKGNDNNLSMEQKQAVNKVVDFYGRKSAEWLIMLSHSEKPWIDARVGLRDGDNGSVTIPINAIAEYFSTLVR